MRVNAAYTGGMVRVWLGVVALVVLLAVFSAVDCAMINPLRIRALPRWAWMLVILCVPVFGAVLWLTVGRARIALTQAPDDDPQFLAELSKLLDDEQRKSDGKANEDGAQ